MAKPSLKGSLVEFDRKPIDPYEILGFVLDWSRDLTLLHVLNTHRMELNGYAVIRNSDVRRWRSVQSFVARARTLKGIKPAPLDGISLANWRGILDTASKQFSLLTIHREAMDPSVCYIGTVASLTEKTVTMRMIDPDARWADAKRLRFENLTKVEFGGGYEEALAMVAKDRTKGKKRRI